IKLDQFLQDLLEEIVQDTRRDIGDILDSCTMDFVPKLRPKRWAFDVELKIPGFLALDSFRNGFEWNEELVKRTQRQFAEIVSKPMDYMRNRILPSLPGIFGRVNRLISYRGWLNDQFYVWPYKPFYRTATLFLRPDSVSVIDFDLKLAKLDLYNLVNSDVCILKHKDWELVLRIESKRAILLLKVNEKHLIEVSLEQVASKSPKQKLPYFHPDQRFMANLELDPITHDLVFKLDAFNSAGFSLKVVRNVIVHITVSEWILKQAIEETIFQTLTFQSRNKIDVSQFMPKLNPCSPYVDFLPYQEAVERSKWWSAGVAYSLSCSHFGIEPMQWSSQSLMSPDIVLVVRVDEKCPYNQKSWFEPVLRQLQTMQKTKFSLIAFNSEQVFVLQLNSGHIFHLREDTAADLEYLLKSLPMENRFEKGSELVTLKAVRSALELIGMGNAGHIVLASCDPECDRGVVEAGLMDSWRFSRFVASYPKVDFHFFTQNAKAANLTRSFCSRMAQEPTIDVNLEARLERNLSPAT
ncbi:hypothetical protein Ciccas_002134, partial [Cichlidogyrus casuarinus]